MLQFSVDDKTVMQRFRVKMIAALTAAMETCRIAEDSYLRDAVNAYH